MCMRVFCVRVCVFVHVCACVCQQTRMLREEIKKNQVSVLEAVAAPPFPRSNTCVSFFFWRPGGGRGPPFLMGVRMRVLQFFLSLFFFPWTCSQGRRQRVTEEMRARERERDKGGGRKGRGRQREKRQTGRQGERRRFAGS